LKPSEIKVLSSSGIAAYELFLRAKTYASLAGTGTKTFSVKTWQSSKAGKKNSPTHQPAF
jgi:hypothetical protein